MGRQRWLAIGHVLGQWMLYGVLFALVPIVFSFLSEYIRGDTVALTELIGGGELLLVSAGISAAALGELARQPTDPLRRVRSLLTGLSIIMVLIAGLLFADVAGNLRDADAYDTARLATVSLVIFTISLVTAALAMVVAEVSGWT
jgi:hypothetical protein